MIQSESHVTVKTPWVADVHGAACEPLPAARKIAITLAEAVELGLGSERQLRQMIRDGVISKALISCGSGRSRRRYRLLKDVLIRELQVNA